MRSLDHLAWLEHGFGTRSATVWRHDPRIVALHQIHSGLSVEATGPAGRIGDGDALLTRVPGLLLSVRTADCFPILIADPEHRAVAAVHAGWRGVVERITANAVAAMAERFESRPAALLAAIGPGIGACCYEVGPEVGAQFQPLFPERADLGERSRVDLAEANRRLLVAAGIPAAQIALAGLCTSCLEEEFHSYRRDRHGAGRMLSVIGIRLRST